MPEPLRQAEEGQSLGADLAGAFGLEAGLKSEIMAAQGRMKETTDLTPVLVQKTQTPAASAVDLSAGEPLVQAGGVGGQLGDEPGLVVQMIIVRRPDGRTAAEAGQSRTRPAEG